MGTKPTSRGQKVADDITALLQARNPLIWITTREEKRVETFLFRAASAAGYKTLFWDVAQGVTLIDGKGSPAIRDAQDPGSAIAAVRVESEKSDTRAERNVWVFRDLPVWLEGMTGASLRRQLRNLSKYLPSVPRKSAQAIIVLTTEPTIPSDLAGHATVIEWPLPDRGEIEQVLDSAVNFLPERDDKGKPLRAAILAALAEVRDQAIEAALGLTAEEAASCYARSLVTTRRIDPNIVTVEKKRVIAKEGVVEWIDPLKGGLDAVGGLENLKSWLIQRKLAFSPEARQYGLQSPRGILLIGPPGTGKSLTAKAVATAWSVPLLKMDLGALKGKYVGESEGRIRKAFQVVEAAGHAILWIDEIEKALAGATQGAADGGVSADALGTILQWMQERKDDSGIFVVATANDAASLPPELMRAGRFDSIWMVDIPNRIERDQIFRASLRKSGRSDELDLDYEAISRATEGFTGSEIAAIVPDAMFAAFADQKREICTQDIIESAARVVPLTKTAAEKIAKLREWAKGRARLATRTMASEDLTDILGERQVEL